MEFQAYSVEFRRVAMEQGYTPEQVSGFLHYAQNLVRQEVPIIFDQQHLSLLLGYDYGFLLYACNSASRFYKRYAIPKSNGGERCIEEPFPSLKEIQRWILDNILTPASVHHVSPVAKAFVPNRSLRSNARFHRNRKKVVALDLCDFFGNVRFSHVFCVFKKLGYTNSVSAMLTKLCMVNGRLPQGAPTSPMLSNLVFFELDNRIFTYCKKRKIMYTRYADDLTFSSDILHVGHLIAYVRMLLEQKHFSLNERKTKVMGKGTCQRVTGIVVNAKLQVPKEYRDKIRQEVYYSTKYGFEDHMNRLELPNWVTTPKLYIRHLLGKVNHVLQVNPHDKEFIRYAVWLKEEEALHESDAL